MNEQLNQQKAIAAMTRAFFDGFFTGLTEGTYPDSYKQADRRMVKQLVAAQYEHTAQHFTHVMMPLLMTITFDNYDQAVEGMRLHHFSKDTPVKVLLRYACRTRDNFQILTHEYQRQLTSLLEGRLMSISTHLSGLKLTNDAQLLKPDKAIRGVVRAVMQSYAHGIKTANADKQHFRQTTVLRLMVNGMTALTHQMFDDPWQDADKVGLEGVYLKACGKPEYFELLTQEMDQAYQDLI